MKGGRESIEEKIEERAYKMRGTQKEMNSKEVRKAEEIVTETKTCAF